MRRQKWPHLEHLDENEDLGVFEVDGPSARNARHDGVDERLSGQRIVIAHFEFNLVLQNWVKQKQKQNKKNELGVAVTLNRDGVHPPKCYGRTRESESGCCVRNGFKTRCASDLISGALATHVLITGVRR